MGKLSVVFFSGSGSLLRKGQPNTIHHPRVALGRAFWQQLYETGVSQILPPM
jgi:hypothetical protein